MKVDEAKAARWDRLWTQIERGRREELEALREVLETKTPTNFTGRVNIVRPKVN